jgi:hypothetical protein
MKEEVKTNESDTDAAAIERAASAVCIFCKKVGCVDLLDERTPEAEPRAVASGPLGHARTVFHRARLLEEASELVRPKLTKVEYRTKAFALPLSEAEFKAEFGEVGMPHPAHGVCLDCLEIEATMNVAHMEATRILLMTAALDAGATIATMAFLAHLICHGIENLDSLQDRLVSSKPLFQVLFPVLPPPSPLNPNRGRSGFDLAVAHVLASLLVQHSVPVACMAIMLVMHAKAYESGENLETLQEALRCGENDFLSVKGMLTAVQSSDARQVPQKLPD